MGTTRAAPPLYTVPLLLMGGWDDERSPREQEREQRRLGGLGRKGQPSACVARSGEDNPEKASRRLRASKVRDGLSRSKLARGFLAQGNYRDPSGFPCCQSRP